MTVAAGVEGASIMANEEHLGIASLPSLVYRLMQADAVPNGTG